MLNPLMHGIILLQVASKCTSFGSLASKQCGGYIMVHQCSHVHNNISNILRRQFLDSMLGSYQTLLGANIRCAVTKYHSAINSCVYNIM